MAAALGIENLANNLDPLQMAAQANEMIDLVAGQRILDQAVEQDARLFDLGIKRRRAGIKSSPGKLAAQVKVQPIDLAPGVDTQALLRAPRILSGQPDQVED